MTFFLVGTFLSGILGIAAIYYFGFGMMADLVDKNPGRLRDFTFPIWHSHSLFENEFLVFITLDGFANKAGYAGHATAYLWFMNLLYHVQYRFPL